MLFPRPPSDFSPRFEVVGCFCVHDGEILLLHRADDDESQPNVWGLPAGKREANETIQDAMLREMSEETGMTMTDKQINLHSTVYARYPDRDFVYHMFSTEMNMKPEIMLSPSEHKAYKWVTPQEALTMELVSELDACIKLYFKISE